MSRKTRPVGLRALSCAVLAVCTPVTAWAGAPSSGSISFLPIGAAQNASPVPTLGGAMLILMALLLAFIAFKNLREQRGKTLLALALAVGSALSAIGGVTVIDRANAGNNGIFTISNSQGESFPIFDNQFNEYTNNAGVPMRVQSVLLPAGCSTLPVTTECTGGLQLPQNGDCQIDCQGAIVSDLRLKTDITVVGRADNGLPLYQFRYIGGQKLYEGVMAQDVLGYMPAAVVPMENGFLAVNYQMLGLRMLVVE